MGWKNVLDIARDELRQRRRILCVDERLLLDVLNCGLHTQLVALPNIEPIPEDVEIVAVWNEPHRRCLMVELCHPSFELVSPGCPAPLIGGSFDSMQIYRLQHCGAKLESTQVSIENK